MERQQERQDCGGMYGGKMMGILGHGCCGWTLLGKRKRGKPKRRFMDGVKEDMAEVNVTEERYRR